MDISDPINVKSRFFSNPRLPKPKRDDRFGSYAKLDSGVLAVYNQGEGEIYVLKIRDAFKPNTKLTALSKIAREGPCSQLMGTQKYSEVFGGPKVSPFALQKGVLAAVLHLRGAVCIFTGLNKGKPKQAKVITCSQCSKRYWWYGRSIQFSGGHLVFSSIEENDFQGVMYVVQNVLKNARASRVRRLPSPSKGFTNPNNRAKGFPCPKGHIVTSKGRALVYDRYAGTCKWWAKYRRQECDGQHYILDLETAKFVPTPRRIFRKVKERSFSVRLEGGILVMVPYLWTVGGNPIHKTDIRNSYGDFDRYYVNVYSLNFPRFQLRTVISTMGKFKSPKRFKHRTTNHMAGGSKGVRGHWARGWGYRLGYPSIFLKNGGVIVPHGMEEVAGKNFAGALYRLDTRDPKAKVEHITSPHPTAWQRFAYGAESHGQLVVVPYFGWPYLRENGTATRLKLFTKPDPFAKSRGWGWYMGANVVRFLTKDVIAVQSPRYSYFSIIARTAPFQNCKALGALAPMMTAGNLQCGAIANHLNSPTSTLGSLFRAWAVDSRGHHSVRTSTYALGGMQVSFYRSMLVANCNADKCLQGDKPEYRRTRGEKFVFVKNSVCAKNLKDKTQPSRCCVSKRLQGDPKYKSVKDRLIMW